MPAGSGENVMRNVDLQLFKAAECLEIYSSLKWPKAYASVRAHWGLRM